MHPHAGAAPGANVQTTERYKDACRSERWFVSSDDHAIQPA